MYKLLTSLTHKIIHYSYGFPCLFSENEMFFFENRIWQQIDMTYNLHWFYHNIVVIILFKY